MPSQSTMRETVESIVVAFVLAFLFRTFEAEAFVIPTGSMAPTLMGGHRDVICPKCGFEYQVSDSEQQENAPKKAEVEGGMCPMCRYPADLTINDPHFNGDRILVAKFPYQFADPQRWDVVVFKYPGDSTMNYIKRLIGLPGETIRIQNGNIWTRKGPAKEGADTDRPAVDGFEIARKPPAKILAMLQPVYDNDLTPAIERLGWQRRWRGQPPDGKNPGEWTTADGASFAADGHATGETWVRYEHLVPSYWQWKQIIDIEGGRAPVENTKPDQTVRPQLISDFTAYNTASPIPHGQPEIQKGVAGLPEAHWVGDLALQCAVDVQSGSGEFVLELVRGGRHFQCRIDVATGKATLGISGADQKGFHPTSSTAIHGTGKHQVIFSNVDDEMRLWVDGSVADFDAPTAYDSGQLGVLVPTLDDLKPAGIASRQAALKIDHIKISRDIYYIAQDTPFHAFNDFRDPQFQPDMADPNSWPMAYAEKNMNHVEFKLATPDPSRPGWDQFFVLGDNSPQSKDGRLWEGRPLPGRNGNKEYWVERELLVGKALLIYWPHSWDRLPYFTKIPFPFFPNFERMHLVR